MGHRTSDESEYYYCSGANGSEWLHRFNTHTFMFRHIALLYDSDDGEETTKRAAARFRGTNSEGLTFALIPDFIPVAALIRISNPAIRHSTTKSVHLEYAHWGPH